MAATPLAFTASGQLVESPAVANGVIYVSSGDKVYALDAATGTVKWVRSYALTYGSSPTVANGVLYVGSLYDKAYAIDAASGDLLVNFWPYAAGLEVRSPAVANGVAYVGSVYGIYAFEAVPPQVSMQLLVPYMAGSPLPISWTGTSATYDVQYRDGPSR